MFRKSIILAVFVTACSQGAGKDLQYIKEARSLAGEWALINEQARANRLTETYVRSMHHWLRDQLQTASSSLTQPNSPGGIELRTLLAEPADAPPERLRAHAQMLKQIEDELESD